MLDKKYFDLVRKELLGYSAKRQEIIKESSQAQFLSKKAIFAMQRDGMAEAQKLLAQAEKIILDLNIKNKKDRSIFEEGSYKAGLEEFVEAFVLNQYLQKKTIGKLAKVHVDSDIFISGLCDVPGELLRYAIKSATEKKFAEVKRCKEAADEIIEELVDMNLTGYNRQKFDQAKQALNKLEQVLYEVSIRQ
ncbi:MAG: translin [Parcubacteria group bacterium Gr01-1014_13]|nr:MAG: translin [Parcubacteria group bacterium Gr01-1014_13]